MNMLFANSDAFFKPFNVKGGGKGIQKEYNKGKFLKCETAFSLEKVSPPTLHAQ